MPEWVHNRAEHILAKNPSMPKSEAWAIATQQGHAIGKTPKGYGTAKVDTKRNPSTPHLGMTRRPPTRVTWRVRR